MTNWAPASEAEVAMRDALRAGDQELYFRILARTELLLPVSADVLAGRAPMGWGTWTSGGRTHVLGFTSVESLQSCLAEHAGSARKIPYHELAQNWPNLEWWLAVDPGLPIEGYLPAWFVGQLARGDVRLPGKTTTTRGRLERLERAESMAARARATAAVPARTVPAQQSNGPDPLAALPSVPISAPATPVPAQAASSPAAPTQTNPGAVGSEPVGSGPVASSPADSGPMASGSLGSALMGSDLVGSLPAAPAQAAGGGAAATPARPWAPQGTPPARPTPTLASSALWSQSERRASAGSAAAAAGQAAFAPPVVPGPSDVPGPPVIPGRPAAPEPADAPGTGSATPSPPPASSAAVPPAQPAPSATAPPAASATAAPVSSAAAGPSTPTAPRAPAAPGSAAAPARPTPAYGGAGGGAGESGFETGPWGGRASGYPSPAPAGRAVQQPGAGGYPGATGAAGAGGIQNGAGVADPATGPSGPSPAAPAEAASAYAAPSFTAAGPSFVPANDVEVNLLKAAEEGSTDTFLSTLLLARVLLPVPSGGGAGDRPGAAGRAGQPSQPGEPGFSWRTGIIDDQIYVVVFTSPERLAEYFAGTDEPAGESVEVKFVKLIKAWPAESWSFAVNPGSPVGAKLPGAQIVALASWAVEVGLGAAGDDPEEAPAPVVRRSATEGQKPTMMQKVVAASKIDYYLARGYDRVCGFVHRATEVDHLRTPAELRSALGLDYPGSPFGPDDDTAYLLRWPAYRPSLYRIPYGGQTETAMRAMEGWVIQRGPFRGNGFAPGESSKVIAEFKVDSARLPHNAQLWRVSADGTEELVAVLDVDGPKWQRVLGGTRSGPDVSRPDVSGPDASRPDAAPRLDVSQLDVSQADSSPADNSRVDNPQPDTAGAERESAAEAAGGWDPGPAGWRPGGES